MYHGVVGVVNYPCLPYSIRLAICSEHTEEELIEAASVIKDIISDSLLSAQ